MITTALIVAGTILSVVAVTVFGLNLTHAPEGLEDETGFHPLRKSRTVRNRYHCAKSEPAVPVDDRKSFKVHIPAA